MLENIINLVKQNAGQDIINNPAIPNERNDEAVHEAGSSIMDTLKNAIAGGKAQDVIAMLSGNSGGSGAIVQQASGDLSQRLQGKFGLNQAQSSGIAGGLVSKVLQQLGQSGINIGDFMGGSGGMMDKVKNMF